MVDERDKLAQNQALRQDVVTFVNYVGDGLRLTQVSKNLTLKDVRAINALLVRPEELDQQVGDRLYGLRNEEEARRVHFIRCLCQVAGLAKIRHGWISQTKQAAKFLKWLSFKQLSHLFKAWWWKDSWGRFIRWSDLAAPYEENADYIAKIFLAMSQGVVVPLVPFAKALSDDLGYVANENGERDQWHTNLIIERTVIYPLELFGALEVDYKMAEHRIKKINAFALTSLGALLFRDIVCTSGTQIDYLPVLDDDDINSLRKRN